jgi:hypothetical protein
VITDETLASWLRDAADEVPLPDDGLAAALAPLTVRPKAGGRRWRSHGLMLAGAAAAVALLVLLGVAVARHGGPSAPTAKSAGAASSGTTTHGAASSGAAAAAAPQAAAAGPAAGVAPAPSAPVPVSGPRVVRTATVSLAVPAADVAATLTRLRGLVAAGGYVQDSTTSLAGAHPTGTVTLRVPSADYARVRDAIAAGTYGKVTALDEHGQDVTAQYTDLGARIDALSQTRTSYLTLLSKAKSIGDVLAVQQQLTAVQQQIESLQGQQKVLADDSDDATLAVTVGEAAGLPPIVPSRSGWSRAFHDAGHGLAGGLQSLVAASGVTLVVLLVLAVLAGLALVGTRRLRRLRL